MLTSADLTVICGTLRPIVEKLDKLTNTIDDLIKIEIKPMRQDITKIRKDLDTTIDFFDYDYLDLRKRVERLEN